MIEPTIHFLSWGGRYQLAGMTYALLGVLAIGSLPESTPPAVAQGEGGCPSGYYDCQGTCISDDEICCEDGTHGSGEMCGCCKSDEETPSTYQCDPEE